MKNLAWISLLFFGALISTATAKTVPAQDSNLDKGEENVVVDCAYECIKIFFDCSQNCKTKCPAFCNPSNQETNATDLMDPAKTAPKTIANNTTKDISEYSDRSLDKSEEFINTNSSTATEQVTDDTTTTTVTGPSTYYATTEPSTNSTTSTAVTEPSTEATKSTTVSEPTTDATTSSTATEQSTNEMSSSTATQPSTDSTTSEKSTNDITCSAITKTSPSTKATNSNYNAAITRFTQSLFAQVFSQFLT